MMVCFSWQCLVYHTGQVIAMLPSHLILLAFYLVVLVNAFLMSCPSGPIWSESMLSEYQRMRW